MNIHTIRTVRSNRTTVCIIEATVGGQRRTFTGVSRRHPEDRPVREIGEGLAQSRAFAKLAKGVERYANGMVRFQDNKLRSEETEAKVSAEVLRTTLQKRKKQSGRRVLTAR